MADSEDDTVLLPSFLFEAREEHLLAYQEAFSEDDIETLSLMKGLGPEALEAAKKIGKSLTNEDASTGHSVFEIRRCVALAERRHQEARPQLEQFLADVKSLGNEASKQNAMWEMSTMVRMSLRLAIILLAVSFSIPLYLLLRHSDHGPLFPARGDAADLSYGLILDAGSTGTRMFLYTWTSSSDTRLIDINPALDHHELPVVKKVYPGLSTFADHPHDAAEYIKPLMDYAVEFIPEEKRPYTPVFIFATAGMRLVPDLQQKAILEDLHTKLPQMTVMQIMKEHIRVIEGKWEGIYSWIAANYILGRFNPPMDKPDFPKGGEPTINRKDTVGMIDMGGASAQIAFELPQSTSFLTENVENVNLGCRDESPLFKYKLFVTTFLGYGVNEGLRKYEQDLYKEMSEVNGSYVRDECLPTNLVEMAKGIDGNQFTRRGMGDWESCVEKLSSLIDPGSAPNCLPSCYFGNVAAPDIKLSDMQFFGFSEFWFSVEEVLKLGGTYNYTMVREKSRQFCNQKWSSIKSQATRLLYPKADEQRLRTQCFKSAWITAVLHAGFDFERDQNKFQSVLQVDGQEVQWALGAMIYHMRYFPLRDTQAKIAGKAAPSSHSAWWIPPAEMLFICAC
ncbi:unnamed protein product, partial [Mesorhabditis spiculigera]